MDFIKKLTGIQAEKKRISVKRDYLDRLGEEQIKKMIELGIQMPVISL